MRVSLDDGPFSTYSLRSESGRDLLIQTDGDVAGVASTFGWIPCPCARTDGTIDCQHRTVDDMIADARSFLDENIGKSVDDPGYF